MNKYKPFLFAAAALLLLSFVTAPKLVKMLQIKEILPGSNYTEKTITGKWLEKSDSLKKDDAYWIAWDNADIEAVSGNRINLPEEEWNKYQTGNTCSGPNSASIF